MRATDVLPAAAGAFTLYQVYEYLTNKPNSYGFWVQDPPMSNQLFVAVMTAWFLYEKRYGPIIGPWLVEDNPMGREWPHFNMWTTYILGWWVLHMATTNPTRWMPHPGMGASVA